MLALGLILAVGYVRTIREALRPSAFLRTHERAVVKFPEFSLVKQLTSVSQELRGAEVQRLTPEQLQQFFAGLNFSLLLNRGVYFWAYQLDKIRRSPIPFMLSIGSYIGLFVATVLTWHHLGRRPAMELPHVRGALDRRPR
jgi:hypothetical protein